MMLFSYFDHRWSLRIFATALALAAFFPLKSSAQPLSAAESDPAVLGWMEGFPPPPDKQIGQPDSNYFSFPKLRWTVCHLRELLPTEQAVGGVDATPVKRSSE